MYYPNLKLYKGDAYHYFLHSYIVFQFVLIYFSCIFVNSYINGNVLGYLYDY